MAVIEKIRKRSLLLLIAIGGAMVLFILSDLLWKGGGGRRRIDPIAKISNEAINYQEFDNKIAEQEIFMKLQYGENYNFSPEEKHQINNFALEQLINEKIIDKEFKKANISISDAEIASLFTGKLVHPFIRQIFTDPKTGQFDPRVVQNYLDNLETMTEDQQKQWYAIEGVVLDEHKFQKYFGIVSKAYYLPSKLINQKLNDYNNERTVQLMGLKYSTIDNDEIKVSDEDLKKYYDEHLYMFKTDPFVDIDFVVFDILPSKKDLAKIEAYIKEAYDSLRNSSPERIPIVVNQFSKIPFDSVYVKITDLPPQADTLTHASKGTILGPYQYNNAWYITSILDEKIIADSVKAKHILITYKGANRSNENVTRTKEEAEKLADSLYNILKSTKDTNLFVQFVKNYSDDQGSVQTNGDLGWFTEGTMIKPFNDACFATPAGQYTKVETDFGIHIIYVEKKTMPVPKYLVANIVYPIEPSSETMDSIYNVANGFAISAKTAKDFENQITEKGYNKRSAERVKKEDFTIPGIENGREIIRWAYNKETKVGTVSAVFDLTSENKEVVALLKYRQESKKPYLTFERVKEEIRPFVIKEKKADILVKKINDAKTNDLLALTQKLNAQLDTTVITFNSYSLQFYGPEPKVIGTMSIIPAQKISDPIRGEGAVFVGKVIEEHQRANIDANALRMQETQMHNSKVNYELTNSLKKVYKVIDNRTLYY
ncbi:MAG TPA: SurA N-terminal domain-containing protein [Bacteroidales bacterium]|nr:SurA N-terminal domain-containing protein [Bacteroidales bacterium]